MNYYNDFDKKACAWLDELMKAGHIPQGEIDDRSIADIKPRELDGFTQCHFFAGIGGWPLALRLAGWPDDREVWTGSCPCQPFSVAGKRKGEKDERHLWPAFRWLIAECKPATVFGEQVASKDGRIWLAGVRSDLEALGYAVGGADLCAAGVGAPQIRQRLWWVADSAMRGHKDKLERPQQSHCADGIRTATVSWGSGDIGWLADSAIKQTDTANTERFHTESGVSVSIGGLANPKGAERKSSGRTRTGREGLTDNSNHGWLADGIEQGLEGQSGDGDRRDEPGRNQTHEAGSVAESGAIIGISNTTGERCGETRERIERCEKRSSGGRDLSVWGKFIWWPCRDGKYRRIPANAYGQFEPAIFPLADGISGRVGLLRGSGNAIVPQVAAEFIGAYMDIAEPNPKRRGG